MDTTSVPASASGSAAVTQSNSPQTKTTEGKGQPDAQREQNANPFKGTKHKTVIDGAEQLVDYDELVAGYQKEKSSQKRYQEAAKIEKAVSDTLSGLASGDKKAWDWLKGAVPKEVFKQVAFDYAYSEMEYESLPPDKKREMELNERERKLHEDEERRSLEAKQAQWQQDVGQASENIQKTIDEFVERSGQKPSSEELFRMTDFMLAHLHRHQKLPSMDQLHDRVSRQMDIDALSVLKKKTGDTKEMLKWLPPDTVKALKRAFLDEATAGQPKRYQPEGSRTDGPSRPKERKKVSIDEAFQLLDKKIKRNR